MSDFAALRVARQRLQEFCALHRSSVEFFRSDQGTFRLHPSSETSPEPGLRHITTTATCIESLQTCPGADVSPLAQWFAEQALQLDEWTSENAVTIYTRCRALPLVIEHTPSLNDSLKRHLERVLAQLSREDYFAIGETDASPPSPPSKTDFLPPNAFHTFWALEALHRCRRRFGESFAQTEQQLDIARRWNGMILWAWHVLGCQIALHKAKSAEMDTDQLAWSLAIITRFPPIKPSPAFPSSPSFRFRDLIREALACFFDAQDEGGTWPHYEPIFHYAGAGDAYCYVFETLSPLLTNAVRLESSLLQVLLQPYFKNLLRLVDYAEATKVALPSTTGRAFGWSSGHRRTEPDVESWATAAVFQSMQALRRLIGVWTRDEALRKLNQLPPQHSPQEAVSKLLQRGDTWSEGETAGEQLLTMFVHPIQMRDTTETLDPDARPVVERQMRSAILFGPPGTSKTTLARATAAAIGWDYIELHPAHFVAGGLPNVQRTADEIFNTLMELDHCVILFDEIDELMRERSTEGDAFGRFLTTSMLPKLAELWKQRRVIYFVATNHVGSFDDALVRAERFDALILVPPPSFTAKCARLQEVLKEIAPHVDVQVTVTKEDIERELSWIGKLDKNEEVAKAEVQESQLLAKFILLRWDQLDELAHHLLSHVEQQKITLSANTLRVTLAQIRDARLKTNKAYWELLDDVNRRARDFGKDIVWRVEGQTSPEVLAAPFIHQAGGQVWCVGSRDWLRRTVTFAEVQFPEPGLVRFVCDAGRG